MSEHQSNAVPAVLIVSEHVEFAAAASQQLAASDYAVRTQTPQEARHTLNSKEFPPVVALIDCDAKTADGSPLTGTTSPDCQIILICTLDQASAGAEFVRSGEAYDYVLTDSVRDPNRLVLLVERAGMEIASSQSNTGVQYERVLHALADMREVLKDDSENPIIKLLDGLKLDTSSTRLNLDRLDEAAEGYENWLVEFISGRLRRLENQILLLGGEKLRSTTRLTSSRILVVEDDAVSGELAKHILDRHGFDVVVARTAIAAWQALNEYSPDLVLMDVHLGDSNGLQLVKRLRAGGICPNVPVIVTTSDRMRDTLLNAVDVNVQGYLLKPYEPSLLVQKAKAVLAESKAEPADTVG